MKKAYLLSILILCSGTLIASKIFFHKEKASEQLLWECTIGTTNGEILWQRNCTRCLPRNSGHLIESCDNRSLKLITASGELIWQKPFHIHHDLRWDGSDQNIILALSSELHETDLGLVRFDILLKLDINGNVKSRFSFYEHKNEIANELKKAIPEKEDSYFHRVSRSPFTELAAKVEFSHVNSFYRIPKNDSSKLHPAFQENNYIINSQKNKLIMVLDNELKKILWSMSLRSANGGHDIHDVQVLPDGSILLFSNKPNEKEDLSYIEVWNPITKKLIRRFPNLLNPRFYSPFQGSVQKTSEGNLLFTNNAGTLFRTNKTGTRTQTINTLRFYGNNLQGITIGDYRQFLINNKIY